MTSKLRKIYFLGIGGIAMANLACLLKKKGYLVSGSDIDTFGPSAELLKTHKISYFKDHNPSHIKLFKPDITVIGNAIQRGNPSLEYVLNNRLLYCSMPEIIKTQLLLNKKPIVITGTSGKTTTTALATWILYKAGLKPTALVGGIMKNLNSGFLNGNGEYVVLEGDEYNSSFYDSSPKFMHYLPYIGLINNIQPDHLDIYGSIEEIIKAFRKLPRLIPEKGLLVMNANDKNSMSLKNDAKSKIETFGQGGSVMAKNIKTDSVGLDFNLYYKNKLLGKIKTKLLGKHNVENILAASAIALNVGISFKKIAEAMATFEGVKRRLEVIYDKNKIKIIDDLAHNPDKVLASLSALRSHFPKHQIVAIFEPRTGSSRRKFFQNIYPPSFKPADLVYIAEPYKKSALDKREVFSSRQLVSDLNKNSTEAYALATADDIITHIKTNRLKTTASFRSFQRRRKTFPTIFCVMTSGGFDDIHQKLISLFK